MSHPGRVFAVEPLLVSFRETKTTVKESPRDAAIRGARKGWLNERFLDTAQPERLTAKLTAFYRAALPIAWHEPLLELRVGALRHGLNHLLRGRDPLSARYERCARPAEAYYVPGLGPTFWSAIVKALDPDRMPDWGPAVREGLTRVGLLPEGRGLDAASQAYAGLLDANAALTATDLDRFFAAVAGMTGRELGPSEEPDTAPGDVAQALREVRTRKTLRKRSAEFAEAISTARQALAAAVAAGDDVAADAVLRKLVVGAIRPTGASLLKLLAGLEKIDDPVELAAFDLPLPLDLAIAALHLRRPNRFPLWSDAVRAGARALDDALDPALPVAEQYALFSELALVLRERFKAHPSEIGPLLEAVGGQRGADDRPSPGEFGGFCTDTFRFLAQLGEHNETDWMAARRDRYRFAVRDPMVELCTALAARYVGPVLGGEYGWQLETEPRPGRALTSICKNDFGRSGPYVPVVWVTFYRKQLGHKRDDVQLFVRLDPHGVSAGFHLGRSARDAGRRFRKNVQEHGELVFAAARATGATDVCRFTADVGPTRGGRVKSAADLRAWVAGKELFAARHFSADAALLRTDDLVGEVLILFDRLVPLFAAAVEDDPRPILARRAGSPDARPGFDRDAFRAATGLGDVWLSRVLELLNQRKQLILQGVPGTGKTHVARTLARLLTGDRADCTRLVQFHPGYSYEEFVEGIRPRAVEVNGRSEVTYPVEPGLLAAFANRAEKHPADPHVLVVDEINRGNLPRVFGELLFLLEYREQEATLPYSKRPFRLPNNLYLIGTMNPTDRSAVGLDRAVRRRFSFVDMPPDPAVLARWLDAHPPADPDPQFGPRLVQWFEDINRRLARDHGPDRQVGHSFFMVPGLTADGLRTVWEHHVRPTLEDLFPGRPERVRAFDPARAFDQRQRRPRPVAAD